MGLLGLGVAGMLFSSEAMASLTGIMDEFDNLLDNIKDIGTDIGTSVKETIHPVDTSTLLETISSGESVVGERGYDVTYARGAVDPDWARGRRLSEMSMSEVESLQRDMLRHPGNVANSSAVGKYQIIKTTLFGAKGTAEKPEKGSIAEQLGLKPEDKFSKETQEKIGVQLLKRRGLEQYQKGEITEEKFQENLAKEWAAIPMPQTGKSFYPGQKATIPQEKIQNAIRKERTQTSQPINTKELPKEVLKPIDHKVELTDKGIKSKRQNVEIDTSTVPKVNNIPKLNTKPKNISSPIIVNNNNTIMKQGDTIVADELKGDEEYQSAWHNLQNKSK